MDDPHYNLCQTLKTCVHADPSMPQGGNPARRRSEPGTILLGIVPAESHLEIDALVLNWDIGFVHAGQDGQIKVDTVNFSRYGLLHGKVLSVSPDAITGDKPQGKTSTTIVKKRWMRRASRRDTS